MKLSVSNLAWPSEENEWCLTQLAKFGIKGVELAPTKVFGSWEAISNNSVDKVKGEYQSRGLSISSFQAITYGLNDIALCGEKFKTDRFIEHMGRVAALLYDLGGQFAVFGSPSLRNASDANQQDLINVFTKVEQAFSRQDVHFALETVPTYYGCQLFNTLEKTDEFLNNAGFLNITRHFDSACQFLTGDLEAGKYHSFLERSKHLHISEVDLKEFSNPSQFNLDFIPFINKHYQGDWCVLEMGDKNYNRESFLASIKHFTRLLQ